MHITVIFGLFGLIVGSFLNVLILRHGALALRGRSKCPHCKTVIAAYDLIPVLSWLALRGRCRACSGPISIQYPIVEALTAVSFGVIGAAPLALPVQLIALPMAALLIAIAVYDLYHTIIPDRWVWSFNALALVSALVFLTADSWQLTAILAGPLVATPLFCLWLVSRGRWMGLGDAKLALGIGWLLGTGAGMAAVFLAFLIGAVVSVGILLPLPFFLRLARSWGIAPLALRRSYTMKSEIPFGPFLIASCVLIWILQMYGIQLPNFWYGV